MSAIRSSGFGFLACVAMAGAWLACSSSEGRTMDAPPTKAKDVDSGPTKTETPEPTNETPMTDGGQPMQVDNGVIPQGGRRAFVTSGRYASKLIAGANQSSPGFDAADTICQNAALNGKLGGRFRAWLAAQEHPGKGSAMPAAQKPGERIGISTVADGFPGYYRLDAKPIGVVLHDAQSLTNPISVTEYAQERDVKSETVVQKYLEPDCVFTGLGLDLTPSFNGVNWSEATAVTGGRSTATDIAWQAASNFEKGAKFDDPSDPGNGWVLHGYKLAPYHTPELRCALYCMEVSDTDAGQ